MLAADKDDAAQALFGLRMELAGTEQVPTADNDDARKDLL